MRGWLGNFFGPREYRTKLQCKQKLTALHLNAIFLADLRRHNLQKAREKCRSGCTHSVTSQPSLFTTKATDFANRHRIELYSTVPIAYSTLLALMQRGIFMKQQQHTTVSLCLLYTWLLTLSLSWVIECESKRRGSNLLSYPILTRVCVARLIYERARWKLHPRVSITLLKVASILRLHMQHTQTGPLSKYANICIWRKLRDQHTLFVLLFKNNALFLIIPIHIIPILIKT